MTASTAGKRWASSSRSGPSYGISRSRRVRLAPTSRWAMVVSGTRNAWAISAVVRPPIIRSVSATRPSGDSPGWQQVKMRRRRSSGMVPGSITSGSRASASATSAACASARRAWRRRSKARRRAVVSSQAPGRPGTPLRGQCSSAWAKASWTTSSAVSRSRTIRTTEETTRAYSTRKTSATRCCTVSTGRHGTSHLPDGPDLDEAAGAGRQLLGPLDGLLLRVALDEIEAAQHFLRLGERAVGHLGVAVLGPHARAVTGRAQAVGHHHLAGGAQGVGDTAVGLDHGLALGGRRGRGVLVVTADQEQVAHGASFGLRYGVPHLLRRRQGS